MSQIKKSIFDSDGFAIACLLLIGVLSVTFAIVFP